MANISQETTLRQFSESQKCTAKFLAMNHHKPIQYCYCLLIISFHASDVKCNEVCDMVLSWCNGKGS